jgi:hypothetical protein
MFIFFPKETFVHVTRAFIFVVRVWNFAQEGEIRTCIVINKQFELLKNKTFFGCPFNC